VNFLRRDSGHVSWDRVEHALLVDHASVLGPLKQLILRQLIFQKSKLEYIASARAVAELSEAVWGCQLGVNHWEWVGIEQGKSKVVRSQTMERWQWKNVSPVVYKGEVEVEAVEGYEN